MVFCGEYVRERPTVSYDRTFLVRLGVHGVLVRSESLKLSMHFPLHCMEWDIINVKEEMGLVSGEPLSLLI